MHNTIRNLHDDILNSTLTAAELITADRLPEAGPAPRRPLLR